MSNHCIDNSYPKYGGFHGNGGDALYKRSRPTAERYHGYNKLSVLLRMVKREAAWWHNDVRRRARDDVTNYITWRPTVADDVCVFVTRAAAAVTIETDVY